MRFSTIVCGTVLPVFLTLLAGCSVEEAETPRAGAYRENRTPLDQRTATLLERFDALQALLAATDAELREQLGLLEDQYWDLEEEGYQLARKLALAIMTLSDVHVGRFLEMEKMLSSADGCIAGERPQLNQYRHGEINHEEIADAATFLESTVNSIREQFELTLQFEDPAKEIAAR